MLKAINITKKINHQIVLDHISLEIKKGACYGFIGYNGCGKTMLLRALCGFMHIDSGEIRYGEQLLGRDFDFIRDAGIIIGETSFLNHCTGYQNLALLARIQNTITPEAVINTLDTVGLLAEKDKKVKKYSLGMKQRLRIAQAIMENPEILILDEPFNALDRQGILDIQRIITDAKKTGKNHSADQP